MARRSPRHGAVDPLPREALTRVPGAGRLTTEQLDRLVEQAETFAHQVRWEGSRGFTVTDEMRAVVSAHASLLTLGLPDGISAISGLTSVIVHPSTIVARGQRSVGGGMYTDAPSWLAGQAHHRGPVLVAWDAVRRHSFRPQDGENVVIHEFAHRLDMADGVLDGTPLLGDDQALTRWVSVFTDAYERLRAAPGAPLTDPSPALRPYGATNAAEFFAVATEAFFTIPERLAAAEPDLYEVLSDYLGQDPAASGP